VDDRTADEPKALPIRFADVVRLSWRQPDSDQAKVGAPLGGLPVQYEVERTPLVPTEAPNRQRIVEEFSAFYRDRSVRLAGFLISIGVPRADAWDIMQETMQKVFRLWDTIEYPWTWARVTASKEYATRLAKGAPVPVEDITDRLPHTPCGSGLAETKYDILTAMQELPMRQRQVLAWSFEEHTPAEIAEHLQMTSEAVRASLYKGRKALVELLRTQDEGDR
jgi:RNA polymerase sigma-70 factor (ECF subfamily)